ncbi:MAG: hypothetical protein ACXACP_07370 [Candidatus Hodarchaeales archaeon]|jgi:hypothetical protein
MSLTAKLHEPRNPKKEISKKVGIGVIIGIIILIIASVLSSTALELRLVSGVFFLLGGIYFIIGSFRDFFNSIIIRKVLKKDINEYLASEDANYFRGYGVAGEDVVAGFFLIVISILLTSFL